MRKLGWAVALVLCLSAAAWAAGEGGADYGRPFARGALLGEGEGYPFLHQATVVEITGEDLVAWGAETLEDAVRLVAGSYPYHADRWPGQGSRLLRLRGAGPAGLTVLLDGVPLNHGYFGTADLASIPADQIARVRLYPGPAPAIFGAETGSGVVEVITRAAADAFTTRFDARFGDRRRQVFSFGLGDVTPHVGYFASASYQTASGAQLPLGFDRTLNEDGGQLDGSAFTRNHYRARLGGFFGAAAEAHATAFFDRAVREAPYDVVNPLDQTRRFPEDQRLGGVMNLRLGAFGPFSLTGEAYAVEFAELGEDFADRDYETLLRERRYRHLRSGVGLTPWLNFGSASLFCLRFTARRDAIDAFIQDLDAPRERFTTQRLELAVADVVRPTNWLQFDLGGGAMSLDPTRANTVEQGGALTGYHGRVGAAAEIPGGLRFRPAFAWTPQSPTMEEWFDAELGNPDLDLAAVSNAEAALDWSPIAQVDASLVGFWRQVRDGIALPTDVDEPVFANELNWQTTGGTLSVAARPLKGWLLHAQGTYQQFDDADRNDDVRLIYMPQTYGSIDARYRFPFGLGATAQVYAAGARRDFEDGQVVDLEPYSLTNMKLFYTYRDEVEVYVLGRNLFDVAYETKRFFPEAGRVVMGGMKLTF